MDIIESILLLLIIILFYFVVFRAVELTIRKYMKEMLFWYNYKPITNDKRYRIAIITSENRTESYIRLHDSNFQKYARLHDYDYFRMDNCSKSQSTTYWCKIVKVQTILNSMKYDYVVWVDSDVIVTDMTKTIDELIRHTGEKDIIAGVDYGQDLFFKELVVNAGVFMIKNSVRGRQFIDQCLKELSNRPYCIKNGKEQGDWAGICYEQGIMNLLISTTFQKDTFLDVSSKYICNYLPPVDDRYYTHNVPAFLLHLAGSDNMTRLRCFERFV